MATGGRRLAGVTALQAAHVVALPDRGPTPMLILVDQVFGLHPAGAGLGQIRWRWCDDGRIVGRTG
jgi:hypothetical protein